MKEVYVIIIIFTSKYGKITEIIIETVSRNNIEETVEKVIINGIKSNVLQGAITPWADEAKDEWFLTQAFAALRSLPQAALNPHLCP